MLVTRLGGGNLDFTAMLAIADVLPVMIGYVDEALSLQFATRPFAEWLEVPRGQLIGRRVVDLIGEQRFELREANYRRGRGPARPQD